MTAICPACTGVPMEEPRALPDSITLHLPGIHCAACIATVEDALNAVPGVREARVNLTLKRVMVEAGAGVTVERLTERLAKAGYKAQPLDTGLLAGQDGEERDLVLRIGVAGFAMMNVMLLSVAVWSGAADATARLFHLLSALIALPAVAFSARPFLASALRALGAGRLNMDVPISLAIVLAALVSLAGALDGGEQPGWFEASLSLTFFLLVGRYLDHKGRTAARSAAAELAALEIPQASVLRAGEEQIVKAADLVPGDVVLVRPGERIPADGTIVEGVSELDRSALTGESEPVPVTPGATVSAGENNLTGPIEMVATRVGEDTSLRRLAGLVATAEGQRSRYSGLADKAARAYAPLVHLLGAGAFVGWWIGTVDPWLALTVAISVLVITCPCALGLAVPAVSTVTTSRLFRKGLLVKSRTALERLAEVDTVVFDKTGTLTTGHAVLTGDHDPADLALSAGLAAGSAHPLSRAIVRAALERGIRPAEVSNRVERPGFGVEGMVDGSRMRLGRCDWIGAEAGRVALDRGKGTPVSFGFAERLREDAGDTVNALQAHGYDVVLLSGDAPERAAEMAAALGIEEAHGGMTPEGKTAWLQALEAQGRKALMIGDGLNDTGALATTHASLAPATALDAARTAADVVLLSDRLTPVVEALEAARKAQRLMRQNIWLSVLYNVVSVPVALAGFATPLVAAIAMSTSSITVTLNAMRGRA